MKLLLADYDNYLRRTQQQPPARRFRAFQFVLAPWVIVTFVIILIARVLDLPFWLQALSIVAVVISAMYFGFKAIKYGLEFDRKPPSAPWLETKNGTALIRAIQRVAISSLSVVTPRTRLREDLKFSSDDVGALFKILREDGEMDLATIETLRSHELTVQTLLDGMLEADPHVHSTPQS